MLSPELRKIRFIYSNCAHSSIFLHITQDRFTWLDSLCFEARKDDAPLAYIPLEMDLSAPDKSSLFSIYIILDQDNDRGEVSRFLFIWNEQRPGDIHLMLNAYPGAFLLISFRDPTLLFPSYSESPILQE